MNPRCRAGDLCVVIDATHRCNLGRIVRIIEKHDGTGDLVFRNVGVVWQVESAQRMTWSIGKKRIRRRRGPVPDSYLKPIRGNPVLPHTRAQRSNASPDLRLTRLKEDATA